MYVTNFIMYRIKKFVYGRLNLFDAIMPQSQVGFFDVIQKNNRATEFFQADFLPKIPAAKIFKNFKRSKSSLLREKVMLLFSS